MPACSLQEGADGANGEERPHCMPCSTRAQQQQLLQTQQQGPVDSSQPARSLGLDSLLAGVEEAVGQARRQAQAAQADAAYWQQQ